MSSVRSSSALMTAVSSPESLYSRIATPESGSDTERIRPESYCVCHPFPTASTIVSVRASMSRVVVVIIGVVPKYSAK